MITRGVPGRGEVHAREERGGVLVAWDPKTLRSVPLPPKNKGHRVVVAGRVIQMRFRVVGTTSDKLETTKLDEEQAVQAA